MPAFSNLPVGNNSRGASDRSHDSSGQIRDRSADLDFQCESADLESAPESDSPNPHRHALAFCDEQTQGSSQDDDDAAANDSYEGHGSPTNCQQGIN